MKIELVERRGYGGWRDSRNESRRGYRDECARCDHLCPFNNSKILKEQGLHENPELFIPVRKEILHLPRRSSKIRIVIFSYIIERPQKK